MPTQNSPAAILASLRSKDRPQYTAEQITEAAHALGSAGGKIGGPARASSLSPRRRTEIASNAALIRWHGSPDA
jgi:hypothetical protein